MALKIASWNVNSLRVRLEQVIQWAQSTSPDLILLQETKVMLVQGTGFNWAQPDHFRIVFLPHEDDLREAIGRIATFLETYRRRHEH